MFQASRRSVYQAQALVVEHFTNVEPCFLITAQINYESSSELEGLTKHDKLV